ncbi:hypothetical protein HHK36_025567 [Tetracentron sinense]|uniref:Cell wall hydroxyproline-rich glycoprotein n=1 Tax=Tetracentron sinense TaxID=13715 RepID=A0A834YKP9_TETSI|nr:hypothetical protein HHK36_025567 [Tetracentron sinense]
MEKSWFLALLFLQIIPTKDAFGVGGGISVGGGGVWIGGGINTPNPSGSSNSRLDKAYTALQAWKSAITDDPFGILETWVGSNVCSYRGVFCADPQEMSTPPGLVVAGIDLNHANLQGSLVKELSLLSDMSLLHLNSNRFTGTVPNTFRDLSSLSELDLSNNHFSGPFPSVTLFIPNLKYLDLRFNNFSGPISEDLFNRNLDAIFLNNNQFEGPIPLNLGNSPASVINLANNKFSGNIPLSFGYMGPAIKEVLLLNNQLTGCIPEGVGFLREMEVLDVSFNSLMGQLPNSISCLNEIEVLNLAHNKLSGVLPDPVCSLRSLVNLTVSYNFFSGFSQDCTKLYFRNVGFDFAVNCIPGRDMQRPQPECSIIPGGGLNCLRIPSGRPLVCGLMVQTPDTNPSPPSKMVSPSISPP